MKKITQQLRQRLCNVFHCEVALKVAVTNIKDSRKPVNSKDSNGKSNEEKEQVPPVDLLS